MKFSEVLVSGANRLKSNNIDNFQNEARWLLESITDKKPGYMFFDVDDSEIQKYNALIDKRISGEPLQYLIGIWEFYGYDYCVGPGVLIPRPETEMLVDYAKDYLKQFSEPVVIDFCSGSGCIGLTVAKEVKNAKVILVEKYDDAFAYLKKNAQDVTNAKIIQGDIFENIELPECDLILSNPPYINTDEIPTLQKEVLFEPITALDGGDDGLMFYYRLFELSETLKTKAIAMECGENQSNKIEQIFSSFDKKKTVDDFNGIGRMVCCERYT